MTTADPVAAVRTRLKPRFEALIAYLNETDEVLAASFFTGMLVSLLQADSEDALLAVFFELSATAFMGFQFDEQSWAMADHILEEAQHIAHTFSAPADNIH